MTWTQDLRRRLVDSPDSMGAKLRLRRWDLLRKIFPDIEQMSVIDLGGTVDSWARAPVRPARVHCLNLEEPAADGPSGITAQYGDACDLPAELRHEAYDVVFSNSVIEHVGGHAQRQRFADSVHSLSTRHWIQTPYRYFPIEPHWLFPGFQFLPPAGQAEVARRWKLVHTPTCDRDTALNAALSVELIGKTELRHYFPRSVVMDERLGGLIKSITAVKTA